MFSTKLTDDEFTKFSDLIYKTSGIHLSFVKKELVHARLGKIIRQRNITSYKDYYRLVVADKSGQELIKLLDAISTNQTFFFRENDHFVILKDEMLPEIIQKNKMANHNEISIWSAGCSSGEEPYSIALIFKEYFNHLQNWNFTILATDISTSMLEKAENGIYHESEFAQVSNYLIKKFFQYGTGKWSSYLRIKKDLKDLIHFTRYNLLDDTTASDQFDVIFCRNVMIYFDPETREKVIDKFYRALRPKSYLITGHSESLFNIKHRFKYIKPTLYKKE